MVGGLDGQPVRKLDHRGKPASVEIVHRREVLHGQRVQPLRRSLQRADDERVDIPAGPNGLRSSALNLGRRRSSAFSVARPAGKAGRRCVASPRPIMAAMSG
jgi:hypothetical protein